MKAARLTFVDKITLKIHYRRSFRLKRTQKIIGSITSDLEANEPVVAEITKIYRSKKLTYSPENFQTNSKGFINLINLQIQVLRIRGLTRWLCQRIFRELDLDFYEMSRFKLFCFLFGKYNRYKTAFLRDIGYGDEFFVDLNMIPFSAFTHADTDFKIVPGQRYELQSDLKNKNKYRSGSKPRFYLSKIIVWDSRIAQNLIDEIPKIAQIPSYLLIMKAFPDFRKQLQTRQLLNVDFHPYCDLTFDQRYENIDLRKPDFVENVTILCQRFIIKDNRWTIIDVTCNPVQTFVAGQWQFIETYNKYLTQLYLNTPSSHKKILKLKKAIFLIGRADENWYHFLLDTLPRYLFLRNLDNSIPLLIRNDLPSTTLEFVAKITSHPILLVKANDSLEVKKLYFFASRSTTFDSKPKTKHKHIIFSPVIIGQLRKFLISKIRTSPQPSNPLKIYIPRISKYRNVINNSEITRFLKSEGYFKIITNKKFFAQQSSFFENARLVVAEGGAVCANMLFMKSTSSILVLRSWRNSRDNLWKLLAEACQVKYHETRGIPIYFGVNRLRRQHSDFFVLLSVLKRKVKRLN